MSNVYVLDGMGSSSCPMRFCNGKSNTDPQKNRHQRLLLDLKYFFSIRTHYKFIHIHI
jgi:hypothetical protein